MVIRKTCYFLLCITQENAFDNGRELFSVKRDALLHNPNYVLDYSMIGKDSYQSIIVLKLDCICSLINVEAGKYVGVFCLYITVDVFIMLFRPIMYPLCTNLDFLVFPVSALLEP